MHDIFISYSTQNDKQVQTIRKALEDNGFSYWFAPLNIRGHQDFTNVIPAAIKSSKAFLLLLSKDSQESKWVQRELGVADDNNIPIYTLFLEDCELTESFKFILRYNQHYSIPTDGTKAIEKLITELKEDFTENQDSEINMISPKKAKKTLIISVIAAILAVIAIITCISLFTGGNKQDEYIIRCPAYNIVLTGSSAANPHYLAGKTFTSPSAADSDSRWQITYLDDGTVNISCNGLNLGIQPGYNGVGLGGDYTADKWTIIEDTDSCVYIRNAETLSYLEWYADKSNWSSHDKLTTENKDMFLLKLDKIN